MSGVFLSEVAVDQNIINVHSAKNIQVVSQSIIDVVLKCHGARPDRPRQAITCGARQSRAALLAWRAT